MRQGVQARGQTFQRRHAINPETRETVELSLVPIYVRNRGIAYVYLHGASFAQDVDDLQAVIHWRLFFATDYGFSLEANSQYVGNMDRETRLLFRWRDCAYPVNQSARVQKVFGPFDLKKGLVIQDIINLLLKNRRDRYRLDKNYHGCLTWCQTVIDDLEKEGWVAQNLSDYFRSELLQCRNKYGSVVMPHGVGTFY